MTNVSVGEDCYVENAIISENAIIKDGVKIGIGEKVENEEFPNIYNHGITVIGEGTIIPPQMKIGKNCSISNFLNVEEMGINSLESGKNLKGERKN